MVKGKTIALDVKVDAIDSARLVDIEYWRQFLKTLIETLGMQPVNYIAELIQMKEENKPGGASVVWILLESHVSVDCWSEENYFRLELSSCKLDVSASDVMEFVHRNIRVVGMSAEVMDWNPPKGKGNVIYGWHLLIDLVNCDVNRISDPEAVREFSEKLCNVISMVPYGKPIVEYFGTKSDITAGLSLVQLIETSSITAHFSESFKSAHIDIFSCKSYDWQRALLYTKEYFVGDIGKVEYVIRYCR